MKNCTLLKGKNLAFVMFFLFFALGGIAQTGKTPKSDMRVIARHYPDPNESGCPYVKINWGSDLGDSFFDFETGSIPSYWENDQTYPWVIADPTNYSSYTNSYCIKSGNDSVPNSTSSISATVDYVRTGTISFSAGCWGEGTTTSIWDKCEFYIDGVLKFKEGAAQVWNDTTFDVNAGTHTFTWSYTKDGSVNEDGDAFFVDNVRFDGIDNSKAWTNYYDVYRTHCSQTGGQIADDRVLVAHEVAVTYAIDSTWINLEEGEYQYVVELLYSTSVEESYSNCITKTPVSEFNIAVAPNPADAGVVTGGGTYTIGTTCTLRATASKYYDFYAWIQNTDTVSRNNPYSFKVTQDGSFIGQFDPKDIDYYIAVYPDNSGSVDIEYDNWYLQYNDTITLKAYPTNGFHFVKWTAEGGAQRNIIDLSTSPEYTFVLTGALLDSLFGETIPSGSFIYFTGIFDDEVNYPITAVAVPEDGGTVTGAGSYHFNDTCTLVATENYGYHFLNWTYNDDEVSTEPTYQFFVMDTALYVANFERNNYPVTATAVPEDGGTVTGAGTYPYGDSCTLVATANEGYTFQAWALYGDAFDTIPTIKVEVVDTLAFEAYFELNSYDIVATVNPTVGGTVSGAGTYDYGETCTLVATEEEGYMFLNWTENGQTVSDSPTYTFTVTDGRTLTANFSLNSYSITAVAVPEEGGTVSGAGTYNYGENCTLTATEEYGYHFLNWTFNDDEVSTSPTYTFPVVDSGLYVANFERNNYLVTATAVPEDGGTITGAGTYPYGDSCTLVATANEGYTFQAWLLYEDEYDTIPTIKFEVVDTLAYGAVFELNNYDIVATVNPTVGGTVTGAGTYDYGETCTLVATEEEGYTFLNWTENGQTVSDSPTYTFTVTDGRTLTANFSLNSYAITAVAVPEEGGTVSGAGTYNYGENCTLTATEEYGYHFLNWTFNDDEVSTAPTYTFSVIDSGLYVANFERNNYPVTATAVPEDGGTITGAGTYAYGDLCTLVATANEGYTFQAWLLYGDTVDTIPTLVNEVVDTLVYEAVFQLNSYEITATVNPTVGGTVTGAGTYDYGETCTLVATEEEGYTFLRWTENGQTVSDSPTYTFTVTAGRTLTANFSLNSYAITAIAVPEVGGTVSGAGTYDYGENCTLTATEEYGYHFLNWTYNDDEVSTDPTYTFSVIDSGLYVANFERNNYLVTATAVPEDGGTITGAGTYPYGDSCTLVATANEGYTFLNWAIYGDEYDSNPTIKFEVVDTMAFEAYFELNSYNIVATVNPTVGGTVTGAGTYDYGESCTLVATEEEGYTFLNWTENGQTVSDSPTYTFTVMGARTLTANFSLNSYAITAVAVPEVGGTVTGDGTYNHGENCTLVAIPEEGYHFLNWTFNDDEVSTDSTYTFMVIDTGLYVANFELISYDITAMVTVNPTEGGSVNGAGTYNYGETCTLTAVPATGFHFVNWTKNGQEVSTDLTYTFLVSEAAEYSANFEINSYDVTAMVTVNPIEGGTVTGAGTFNYGQTCTLTATPATGYHLVNWTKNGEEISTDPIYSFIVTEEASYAANFELNSYEITASANPTVGGTVTGAGTYNHFEEITLTATEGEGYTFVSWMENGDEVATTLEYTFTVTGARTLVANFELNSYEIAASANPTVGGTVTGAGTYNHFEEITLTATEGEGYTFVNWTENGDEVATTLTYTFTVTGPRTLVANFELNSYEIAASANPTVGGTVTGAGTYNHFEEITLTATEGEGYTFVNWTENGQEVATTMEYTFTVTGPRTLVANFELNSYEITVSGTPTNGGSVSGGGTYNHFETCTLTATPAEGYHFVKWTLNGSEVSTSETYSFEVNGPADYVAHFQLNRYAITVTHTTGGSVTGGGNYNHFAICTLRAIPSTGYHFVNWTENGQEVSTNATYTFTVTGPRTLVANFEQNNYTITTTANPTSGGTVTGAGSYTHGQTCTLVATPNQGYYFVEWTKGNEVVSTEEVYSFEVTESATYRARFERFDYSITAEANPEEGGTITGTGETFHYNSTCQLVAHANTGYHFVNWTLNGTVVATTTIYSFVVTASAHYVAHFEIDTFEITATTDPDEGGIVTGGGTYAYGQEVVLMAEAHTDYEFVNWTEGDEIVSEEATVTFVVTESRHLVAHFINTVGVGETEGIHFTIYPNPTSEKLTVECEAPVRQCEIFNMAGAKVYAAKDCTQKFEIGLDNLSVGTYIIRLTSDHFTQTKRFVKE